ncbi:hypothetical protein BBJ28_00002006 [Nothophytophthora sp. Chile5]|nr:hypothetical protein BBJ28_00002006 [Nothophytophthora sp. Chile5]
MPATMKGARVTALSVVLALTTALCLHSVEAQEPPVGTACLSPRVRMSWDAYTDAERQLYFCALAKAMDAGFHQKFVQLHKETLSEAEAHRTCVFIYWHRMFLLGYENMLRSLGPEYSCITLPYWDHLSATARMASGDCSSIEECAPIVGDFGGTSRGFVKDLTIYDVTIPTSAGSDSADVHSLCVNQGPLAHFCGNNTQCAHCVTRGRGASRKVYPTEAYFGSVYRQVFSYDDSISFTNAVERGIHNTIHSKVGGVMAYFEAPIDPLFYAHHSIVDLLQTIYLKCQNGAEDVFLSAETKGSDPRFWGSCDRRTTGSFDSSDPVMMRVTGFDGSTVHVRESSDNLLHPFFKDLPATYGEYVDAKDLGVYSYTYEFSGGLSNMYQNCKAAVTLSAATLLAQEDRGSDAVLRPTVNGATALDDTTRRWAIALFESARLIGYTEAGAKEQMEMITCQHQEECIGATDDYSDLFRSNFGVEGHTRCYTVIQGLLSEDRVIGIPEWRNITRRFFPCPLQQTTVGVTLLG